ncbi:MAG TPA: nuclear transport factor 2 family protein [candidate division Zixibacteria bacterium]|nr:nuclear transport factor 2 family protein [candidate division Zixibacteria bacterium]
MNYPELALDWFRGVYKSDPAVIESLGSDNVTVSYPVFQRLFNSPVIRGKEQVKAFARRFASKWAEPRITIHETITEANQVVLVWSFEARNVAPLREGAEASNEVESWGGITLIRFNDEGKVAAEVGEESDPGPFARLGVGN